MTPFFAHEGTILTHAGQDLRRSQRVRTPCHLCALSVEVVFFVAAGCREPMGVRHSRQGLSVRRALAWDSASVTVPPRNVADIFLALAAYGPSGLKLR